MSSDRPPLSAPTPRTAVSVAVVGDVAPIPPLPSDAAAWLRCIGPGVREALRADLVVANFEAAIDLGTAAREGRRAGARLGAHRNAAQLLHAAGFTDVTLANNHVLDLGPSAAVLTYESLLQEGLQAFGLGRTRNEAERVVVRTVRGIRVALLGFCQLQYPGRSRPGCFPLDSVEASRLIRRAAGSADYTVVYFHEGVEAYSYPLRRTIEAAHRAVEAGADLVVGAHAHTVQGIESYRGRPIVYGLGNFLFPFVRRAEYGAWREATCLSRLGLPVDEQLLERGLLLRCALGPGRTVELQPIPIRVSGEGWPELPADPEAEMAFLREISLPLSDKGHAIWAERDRIERGYCRMLRQTLGWRSVLGKLHRLRPRHAFALWQMLRSR